MRGFDIFQKAREKRKDKLLEVEKRKEANLVGSLGSRKKRRKRVRESSEKKKRKRKRRRV